MSELWRDRYQPLDTIADDDGRRLVRGTDRVHGRTVALKIRTAPTAEARAEAEREAATLLSLRPHPGLPTVRDDFPHNGDYVIVLDWVEGANLGDVVAQRGNPGMPPATVLAWIRDLAAAIDHLHGHDPPIIHGDIKPANAILTPAGAVVLVDLGNADLATDTAGTPGFHAPEAGTPDATTAVDIYGLAATAYTLLTGAPPGGGPPVDERLDPVTAAVIERALRSALSLDPSRRPATAAELVDRVAAWTSTNTATATATRQKGRPGRLRSRRTALCAIAALVAAAVTVAAILVNRSPHPLPAGERRLEGPDRYATAAAVATATFNHPASVVLVRGDSAPDALSALYLAGAQHAPLLFAAPDGLTQATVRALTQLRPRQAFVVGDDTAVPLTVETRLAQLHITAVRLAGPDRYATAAVIAQAGGPAGSLAGYGPTAIVVNDADAASFTAVGAIAYGAHLPILYTNPLGLPPETTSALAEDHITHVIVVGAAASNIEPPTTITTQTLTVSTGPAGAVAIAHFETDALGWPSRTVVLARGDTFSDAIAAGQAAGANRAPLLLTATPTALDSSTATFLHAQAPLAHLDIVGDPTAVSAAAADAALTAGRCCSA